MRNITTCIINPLSLKFHCDMTAWGHYIGKENLATDILVPNRGKRVSDQTQGVSLVQKNRPHLFMFGFSLFTK